MKKKDLSVRYQNLLKEIRENRLRSYQSTPGDIEEHRKAELRVAGDTAGRPLIELIQSADDAMQEAKGSLKNRRVRIILEEDRFDEVVKSPYFSNLSFLRKQESSYFNWFWTPAFAGVTDFGLFTRPSVYCS